MLIRSITPQESIKIANNITGNIQRSSQLRAVHTADSVEISSEGLGFSEAIKLAKNMLAEGQDSKHIARVQEVAQEIDNGTYKVPTTDIVSKILGDI